MEASASRKKKGNVDFEAAIGTKDQVKGIKEQSPLANFAATTLFIFTSLHNEAMAEEVPDDPHQAEVVGFPFELLPLELQAHVLGFVPPLDLLLHVALVCRWDHPPPFSSLNANVWLTCAAAQGVARTDVRRGRVASRPPARVRRTAARRH